MTSGIDLTVWLESGDRVATRLSGFGASTVSFLLVMFAYYVASMRQLRITDFSAPGSIDGHGALIGFKLPTPVTTARMARSKYITSSIEGGIFHGKASLKNSAGGLASNRSIALGLWSMT